MQTRVDLFLALSFGRKKGFVFSEARIGAQLVSTSTCFVFVLVMLIKLDIYPFTNVEAMKSGFNGGIQ